jgi:hypothetical protein
MIVSCRSLRPVLSLFMFVPKEKISKNFNEKPKHLDSGYVLMFIKIGSIIIFLNNEYSKIEQFLLFVLICICLVNWKLPHSLFLCDSYKKFDIEIE